MALSPYSSFETTKLPNGFVTEGLAETRTGIKSPDGPMVDAIAGERFLCPDDPHTPKWPACGCLASLDDGGIPCQRH